MSAVDILEDVLKSCASSRRLARRIDFGETNEECLIRGLLYFTEKAGLPAQTVLLQMSTYPLSEEYSSKMSLPDFKLHQKEFLEVEGELLRIHMVPNTGSRIDGVYKAQRFKSREAAESFFGKTFQFFAWDRFEDECDFDGYEEIQEVVDTEGLAENLAAARLQTQTEQVARPGAARRI